MSDARERRRHYRLRYPVDGRPLVAVTGVDRRLAEVSVRGLRFVAPPGAYLEGQVVRVELKVFGHPVLAIPEAVVLRVEGDECAVWLTEEIDHAVILREQRRIIRRARMENDADTLNLLRTWPARSG